MKKILGFFAALVMVFSLASCGVSQGLADKINTAAENGEHMTYEQVSKKLGDPTIEVGGGSANTYTGVLTWVSGCDTLEEIEAKWEDGKKVKAIVVTFTLGKAVGAIYHEDYKA